MNKKMTIGLVAGITTGIAIYFITKMINEKKLNRQNDRERSARPKRLYPYEYTL